MRAQLEGRTNSEGQVKYCRCTFFGHATPDRAGARPYRVRLRVEQCDWASPPTPLIPFVSFRVFRGLPIPQAKRGRDRNPIPDRSSCPLRPSVHLLFLHWVPGGRRFSRSKAGRFDPHGLRGPCEHVTPVFRLADTASFVVAAMPRCDLLFRVFLGFSRSFG